MDAKQSAGEKAIEFVQEGMWLGLGTGSTVYWSILKLAELFKAGFSIRCVATSKKTEHLAQALGLPLQEISECRALDLTIDGADEVDAGLNLIKGGGGALFREKMVASISRRLVVVVDESKVVPVLGRFPLPVEIVPFGWSITRRRIAELGVAPHVRMKNDVPFITDNGNYILDCQFDAINHPAELNAQLKSIMGVVESGLFVKLADMIVVGGPNGVTIKERNH